LDGVLSVRDDFLAAPRAFRLAYPVKSAYLQPNEIRVMKKPLRVLSPVLKRIHLLVLSLSLLSGNLIAADDFALKFAMPPPLARPWVCWFWINGKISKSGSTADLEPMQKVGIGGVLWVEVSDMTWAPDGPVAPAIPEWQECRQRAVCECEHLGLEFRPYAAASVQATPGGNLFEDHRQITVWLALMSKDERPRGPKANAIH